MEGYDGKRGLLSWEENKAGRKSQVRIRTEGNDDSKHKETNSLGEEKGAKGNFPKKKKFFLDQT